jgi:hypothetical protein
MRRFVFIVLTLLVATAVIAQDNKPESKPARNDFGWARNPYRLDYTIKEMEDGKVVNTRTYSLAMQSAEERGRSFGEVKTGTRVPISTSVSAKEGTPQIQYLDVGINISAQLYVLENSNLLLSGNVEISTLATGNESVGAGGAPIIRQIKSNTTSEVIAGKANQIAALDDPISKHRFLIEVTPTKLR